MCYPKVREQLVCPGRAQCQAIGLMARQQGFVVVPEEGLKGRKRPFVRGGARRGRGGQCRRQRNTKRK